MRRPRRNGARRADAVSWVLPAVVVRSRTSRPVESSSNGGRVRGRLRRQASASELFAVVAHDCERETREPRALTSLG